MEDLKFIQVGELAKGISENILPASDGLTGRTLQLHFEDGALTRLRFDSLHDLAWEVLAGPGTGDRGKESYRATRIRENIFLVDYIEQSRRATTVSLIMDVHDATATAVIGSLPGPAEAGKDLFQRINEGLELTAVSARFVKATIDRAFTRQGHRHEPTTEMVGKRVRYVYSRTETYEHIYLNDKLYTWQCLAGIEKGLADTDRCHYFSIDEGLTLFVWREKVVPTLGLVLIDWHQMKTTGKIFGYESNDFGRLCNTPIGAYAELLNVTRHAAV